MQNTENKFSDLSVALYNTLDTSGILTSQGKIIIDLMGVRVEGNEKSAIGNLLQEWLGVWMEKNNIYHRNNPNTQEPPDFYLGRDNQHDLLEVKTFD
jgi:hypothetical protein